MNVMQRKEIQSWIEKSLTSDIFSELMVDFLETNGKTEGYLADIVYAKVTGKDSDNKPKEVNLFIKLGKNNDELRRNMPVMKKINEREIYFYSTVLPAFKKFLRTKEDSKSFDIFPNCYNTFLSKEMEVLILEDLKKRGYTLLDSLYSVNSQITHLVLKAYAKIHALSFALRDQNRTEFDKLATDYFPINKEFILRMRTFRNSDTRCKKTFVEAGRPDLCEKYDELLKNDVEKVVEEILDDVPEESVIIHCDCHINNLLFKYEDGNENTPTEVTIIDWQLSELHSPVMDISFFLLGGAPLNNLSQLDKLLKYYHLQLTNFLGDLGSNAEEIFPFSKLVDHWKRYSNYGFLWAMTFTEFFFCNSEDAPSFDDIREGYDLSDLIGDMKINNKELYGQRIVGIVDCHWKYLKLLEDADKGSEKIRK